MNKDFIITFSKQRFSPLCAKAEEIQIIDIAHALSLLCRANGHIRHFYSVAQHCLNCAKEAEARGLPADIRLACLLHDASEAHLKDLPSPLKALCPDYRAIEARVDADRMLIATQSALDADGDVLSPKERAAIDALMVALRHQRDSDDAAAIEAATEALAKGTEAFAAQRMNRGIQQALAGKNVASL